MALLLLLLWAAASAVAQTALSAQEFAPEPPRAAAETPLGPQPGQCALFREGGQGYVLKAPTYWLRGTLTEVRRERRHAGLCPAQEKPPSRLSPEDRARYAAALPCVRRANDEREVDVWRVTLRVEAWETPWTRAHGASGWLYRGQFLDQPLREGALLDLDAAWLEACEPR
ncbi:hypothetical protein HCX48_04755 [Rhodocyclus tenuis]|uniref:YARHG domain-containing protein n=1 Tax=Rhodocyclus gracilis TaxID=2929842 RepID=A0ABX0WGX2_9RHOO|nr:hypothetical protein [Rhodocyclus gracilis]NJA88536.1 hypothetical protein [Rhodocyclus gracilis]